MLLNPWPKISRYHDGKGRPSAALIPRGTLTLPPLQSVAAPLAMINLNGDPAAQVIDRAQAEITAITAELMHATTTAERRRLTGLHEMFARLIAHMEDRA